MEQKQVLAEATLAVLRQSVTRDLSPEGVLRNRVRWDPDPARSSSSTTGLVGAKKVAFERAVEVALFYELVNSFDDNDPAQMFLKRDMKKRALSTAPTQELAEFYGALDQVDKAEIDKFVKGEKGNKIQSTIDELIAKPQKRALELLIEKKEKAIAEAKAKGVAVDQAPPSPRSRSASTFTEGRTGAFGADDRAEFWKAIKLVGPQLGKDFKEAFDEHGSAFMMGSTAVNLVRAYQSGGSNAMLRTAFTESLFYMPGYIQGPFMAVDLVAKVKEGQYVEAAKSSALMVAMHKWPDLGFGLLVYNMVSGTIDITRTYFVTRIDADLVEKALRARPRAQCRGRAASPDGALGRAQAPPTRLIDAVASGKGSAPGTPLFFGPLQKNKAFPDPDTSDGVPYHAGRCPKTP